MMSLPRKCSFEQIFQGGQSATSTTANPDINVVSWNIERGLQLSAVKAALDEMRPDIVLLQEVDWNAKRSGSTNIAEQLANSLGMKYLYSVEYEELGQCDGSNPAYHGQAIITAFPIALPRILRFKKQSSFWNPRWYIPNWAVFQRRIGGRLALAAEIDIGLARLVVYNLHLESRGNEELRRHQIQEVILDSRQYTIDVPMLVAGDFNTRQPDAAAVEAMLHAGFHLAVGDDATSIRGLSLDRIFVRGPLLLKKGKVHQNVHASDHYPLSGSIEFRLPPAYT